MTNEVKRQVIADYATHEGDTGSPEVQIALLTTRINELNEHTFRRMILKDTVLSSKSSVFVSNRKISQTGPKNPVCFILFRRLSAFSGKSRAYLKK